MGSFDLKTRFVMESKKTFTHLQEGLHLGSVIQLQQCTQRPHDRKDKHTSHMIMATLFVLRCWEQTLKAQIWKITKQKGNKNFEDSDSSFSGVLLLCPTCSRSIVCLMYIHSSTCILGDTAVKTKSNKS